MSVGALIHRRLRQPTERATPAAIRDRPDATAGGRAWSPQAIGLIWLSICLGAMIVVVAYSNATNHSGSTHYTLFWLGVTIAAVPAVLRLGAREVPRVERLALLCAIGLLDYLPKYLRDPAYPLFHDEVAHWRQTELILKTGKLFQPNPLIPVIRSFPGLHG